MEISTNYADYNYPETSSDDYQFEEEKMAKEDAPELSGSDAKDMANNLFAMEVKLWNHKKYNEFPSCLLCEYYSYHF